VLITNHVLAGALVGAASPGPVTAFLAGVVSHPVLDAVPHLGVDESHFLKVAVVDGLVGLATLTGIAARSPASRRTTVLAGMLGACFLDADKPSRQFFGRSPFPAAVDAWHARIQRESRDRLPQEVLVAVAGALLVRLVLTGSRSR
jgi:hypothetical protein